MQSKTLVVIALALVLLFAGAASMFFFGKAQYEWRFEKPLVILPEKPTPTPTFDSLIVELSFSRLEVDSLRAIIDRQNKTYVLLRKNLEAERKRRRFDSSQPLLEGDALAFSLDSLARRYWIEKLSPRPDASN